jgi:hypothetical protein
MLFMPHQATQVEFRSLKLSLAMHMQYRRAMNQAPSLQQHTQHHNIAHHLRHLPCSQCASIHCLQLQHRATFWHNHSPEAWTAQQGLSHRMFESIITLRREQQSSTETTAFQAVRPPPPPHRQDQGRRLLSISDQADSESEVELPGLSRDEFRVLHEE